MTATTPDEGTSEQTVYLWLAQPPVGREQLLMVEMDHPEHGPTFRPLLFVDLTTAADHRDLAAQAAAYLGVRAVLREFQAVAVLDSITEADR